MAVDTINTFSAQTLAILGVRAYFRPDGETQWIDMGIIKDLSPDEEQETFNFEGARSGLQQIYDTVIISSELSYSFSSDNALDEVILALHAGADSEEAAVGDDAFTVIQSFATNDGELMLVYPNAQANKPSMIVYHPRVSLRRDGQSGEAGTEQRQLGFTATVTASEEYVVPETVNAASPAAPFGYMWVGPTADLDAAETAISAAPTTP